MRRRAAKARDGQVARVALRLSVGEDGKERKAETRIVCVGEGHNHLEGAGAGHVHHHAQHVEAVALERAADLLGAGQVRREVAQDRAHLMSRERREICGVR